MDHEVRQTKTAPCVDCVAFLLPPWPIDAASVKCIECANPVLRSSKPKMNPPQDRQR
jgi:hypothetical protein